MKISHLQQHYFTFITQCHFNIVSFYVFISISILSGTNRPSPYFFPFSNLSLLFLYPLLPLFTGPIKGTEALVKQSNKVVMECTLFQDAAWMRIHSAGVNHFFLSNTLFFFPHLAHYCSIISDVAASENRGRGERRDFSLALVRVASSSLVLRRNKRFHKAKAVEPGCVRRLAWWEDMGRNRPGFLYSGAENRGCLLDRTMRQC